MIVETSAVIAIVRNEPERAAFLAALDRDEVNYLSAASLLEAAIVIDGSRDPVLSRGLDTFLAAAAIHIEHVTERQARIAREAYRDFGKGSGHAAGLNFGDCFAYALAKDRGEPLLYKGGDFSKTDVRAAVG